jgi:Polyketide cyclase / dehydrase and lipid transport
MHMRMEQAVAASPLAAWVVIGEQFGAISESVTAILSSQLDGPPTVGAVRTCRTAAFGPIAPGVLVERLTVFDRDSRRLEYEAVEGMPGFVVRALNRWSVHEGPDGTAVVRVHATLHLKPWARPLAPLLRLRLRPASRQALQELTHRIETGRPHPRKDVALSAPSVQ